MGVPIPPNLHRRLTAARRFVRHHRFWLGLTAFVVLGLVLVRAVAPALGMVELAPEERCHTFNPIAETVQGDYWRLLTSDGFVISTDLGPPPLFFPGLTYVFCFQNGEIVRYYAGHAGEDSILRPKAAR